MEALFNQFVSKFIKSRSIQEKSQDKFSILIRVVSVDEYSWNFIVGNNKILRIFVDLDNSNLN